MSATAQKLAAQAAAKKAAAPAASKPAAPAKVAAPAAAKPEVTQPAAPRRAAKSRGEIIAQHEARKVKLAVAHEKKLARLDEFIAKLHSKSAKGRVRVNQETVAELAAAHNLEELKRKAAEFTAAFKQAKAQAGGAPEETSEAG